MREWRGKRKRKRERIEKKKGKNVPTTKTNRLLLSVEADRGSSVFRKRRRGIRRRLVRPFHFSKLGQGRVVARLVHTNDDDENCTGSTSYGPRDLFSFRGKNLLLIHSITSNATFLRNLSIHGYRPSFCHPWVFSDPDSSSVSLLRNKKY